MRLFYGFCILCIAGLTAGAGCSGTQGDDTAIVFEMYSRIVRSYNDQDLHGVMRYVSEGYRSEIEGKRTYDELKSHRQDLYLNNRSLALSLKNISIESSDTSATATYEAVLRKDSGMEEWRQKDILKKSGGKWMIVASQIIES